MTELPKFDDDLSKQQDDAVASGEVSFLMLLYIYHFSRFDRCGCYDLLINDSSCFS